MHVLQARGFLAGGAGLVSLLFLIIYAFGSGTARLPLQARLRSTTSSAHDGSLGHILNATLGFQKIYIVSLASRTDHRDANVLAAALTGLQIEFIDGVTEVSNRSLPPGMLEKNFRPATVGSWRAHMNAVQKMVAENITSALIMEDDVDWDVRIKSLLQDFAKASRVLMQPLPGTKQFVDPTHPRSVLGEQYRNFNFNDYQHRTLEPTTSPYGDIDRWDSLWLGHCGVEFASAEKGLPLGRVVISDDETVPEPQHIDSQWGSRDLIQQYPAHTRVVHRAQNTVCTLAYALSQNGARRLLYELGIDKNVEAFDLSLRDFCDGTGRPMRQCYTVQPQLFMHHRPRGSRLGYSDVGDFQGENERPFTWNIRWPTKVNFAKLVDGAPESEYIDYFEDGAPKPDFGGG